MGNTLFTSVCRREEVVDFEDISDATFDFISVAVHKDPSSSSSSTTTSTKTKTRKTAASSRVAACDAARSKIVAVVPVPLEPCLSSRTIVGHAQGDADDAMSFNDRLNMLTWDPETTPLPKTFNHDELYVFDEYAPQPTNTPSNASTKTRRSKDGWIRRAVDKYQETKTRRRDAKQRQDQRRRRAQDNQAATELPTPRTTTTSTKKRSLRMTLWGKRTPTTTTKDQPYQLPLMSSGSDILDDDDETQRFLFDQDEAPVTQDLLKTFKTKQLNEDDESEPISDTESDDSGSDATTLCQFYTRFEGAVDDSDSFDDSDSDSDSDWSEWTRSSSTSSCYFSAAEDDHDNQERAADADAEADACVAPLLSTPTSLSEYLCDCGDCPAYMAIERDVTNSNCWMNETERRALCRVLQAYSSFSPKTRFCKDMIASAEECLVVFQGDELAAFHAFARLAQTKW